MACFVVHLRGGSAAEALTDEPVIVIACAANKRELTGICVDGRQVFHIFQPVEGLYVETLVCAPYQFLIEIGAF